MIGKNNSFKQKFNFILLGALVVLFTLGTAILFSIITIKTNVENSQRVSETLTNLSSCQTAVRGFLLNAWSDTSFVKAGTNSETDLFYKESKKFTANIEFLKANIAATELPKIVNTENEFIELDKDFTHISQLIKERGYKDVGIEGDLRREVHKIENANLLADKSSVLKLRKHEKDFFLRRDEQYLGKFNAEAVKLNEVLNNLPASPDKEELLKALQSYSSLFNKVVDIERTIGLTKNTGLKGDINQHIEHAVQNLTELTEQYNETTNNLIISVVAFIVFIFSTIIIIAYFGLNKLIKPIFEPMHDIQDKATEISEGNLSVKFDEFKNNKVLKELIDGFEKIIDKFKTTMVQVEGISSRQMLAEIPLNSDKDEVGITLNKIISQIRTIDHEEKRRTWQNEGLAKFASILRINDQSTSALYDTIIKELVKYLNANQGAMFTIEDEDPEDIHMTMKSCYAYDKKKFLNKRVNYGEGLVGTCWIEGETIYLTDVPKQYINITSGLGDALPRAVLIVPVKFNDAILGVIEIASFNDFEAHQIRFTEMIGENIGALIHNLKSTVQTSFLLEKSRIMTEELQSQEEELRQNMEEMQSTQEELQRSAQRLNHEIEKLKAENKHLKDTLTEAGVEMESL